MGARKNEELQKEARKNELAKTEQDVKAESKNDVDAESFIGKIAFSPKTREILHLLKLEAVCASSSSSSSSELETADEAVKKERDDHEKTPCKKRRISGTGSAT